MLIHTMASEGTFAYLAQINQSNPQRASLMQNI
jgi:hypothetical protein